MTGEVVARRIEVNGIVQGVGFRPFVYKTALAHGLKGDVANTAAGVIVQVEGASEAVDAFQRCLSENPPPLARIVAVSCQDMPVHGFDAFAIVHSRADTAMATLISPDVAVCEDCRRELFDPADRRYRYPFINCTNCGPRYTIIDDIPYDRPKTSMKAFVMCGACQAEYDDPLNRRFHAQPNACPVCGPRVQLFTSGRQRVDTPDPVAAAAERIREGAIVAVKGLGGFHLAVDAENNAAVIALRRRKRREEKPFALMSPDLAAIGRYAEVAADELRLLTAIERPIVLLRKKEPNAIAAAVAPRNRFFGVMLPYTPLHHLLLDCSFSALVMTSANLSEEPIAIANDDAFARLADIADYFLVHDREIYLRSDDSIVRRAAGQTRFIRRSRGYVPVPVFLKASLPPILAVGAELKNTVCLTKGAMAFVSQHIGDLENLATYEFFELTIRHLKRILETEPELVVHDLHPDYLSTRWALEQPLPAMGVQHHHAHIVGAMAENRIEGPVIGLSFDGTGFGTDRTVWGGEVLIAEPADFRRAAHLAVVPMPGAAAAIRQPWRMAVSYLADTFGEQWRRPGLALLDTVAADRLTVAAQMARRGLNAPLTSSLGRLFDAVAAIAGLRTEVAFEGQAAMELEMTSDPPGDDIYDYEWRDGEPIQILTQPILRGVVADAEKGVAAAVIGAKFHATLVRLFTELCGHLRRTSGINRVVLSGGVFQNVLLLEGLFRSLGRADFEVYTHTTVPCNDGGISLGQAVAAAARMQSGAR